MIAATINPDTYSILPCPKGCLESAFIPPSLNPSIVTKEEAASDRLLNASAVIAIDWLIVPAINLPANSRIDTALTPLYDVSEEMFVPYCKLKTQEVLMFLVDMEPDKEENLTRCVSAQAEQVKQIHDFLVENADKRFTIEELSRKYLINTSSLKSVFKMIYGMPVAAYMKDYRMKKAMKMLRETDDSVAEIAERVGYGTQGKFTKAFKESVKALPTEYRKMYRKQ